MKISDRLIPVRVIKTQFGQFVEVYEVEPGDWVDLATNIRWTVCPKGRWTSQSGMHAEAT